MDRIWEALDKCAVLVLVITPEAIGSKYVKMEYGYFFNHDKPIIPIMLKSTDKMPPELSGMQYIDFRDGGTDQTYESLYRVLQQHLIEEI